MGAILADAFTRELEEAESRVREIGAALTEARAATVAAEAKFRKRQRQEARRLRAYEQAQRRAEEVAAAEQKHLEDARRTAPGGPTVEERLAALVHPDGDDAGEAAYESEWYRVMLQQSQEP